MARWKLMVNHYLNVPGNKWEYMEVARSGPKTGRQIRKEFDVPRFLDINDPQDWTNRWGNKDNEDGEIIVGYTGKCEPNDVVFVGDPSPDMEPVDDEAKAISATFQKRWATKPDFMPGEYSQSLVDKFQVDLAEMQSKPVEVPGLNDLVAAIGALVGTMTPKPEARRV